MSNEDTIGYSGEEETCVVCGKALRPGEALATLHQSETKLPICYPLCLEAYQADPKQYLERLAKYTLLQELQHLTLKAAPPCKACSDRGFPFQSNQEKGSGISVAAAY